MGFSYLDGNNWSGITREERYFCALLYEHIRKQPQAFVAWLNEAIGTQYDTSVEWEAGYEVCLYRDVFKMRGESIRFSDYPDKRTFDFCLFSEDQLVIIEAKVQQGFEGKQMASLTAEKDLIRLLFDRHIDIDLMALTSSRYLHNLRVYGKRTRATFEEVFGERAFSWKQLAAQYGEPAFQRAESLYKK